MTGESGQGAAVRDIARDAVRSHVASVAVDLFERFGFDEVAIDQIATAAGISRRTFHRYFAAKEDVVVGEPARMTRLVHEALRDRPATEPAWTSLRLAYATLFPDNEGDSSQGKRMIRLMMGTASLRARNLEKHLRWAEALTPVIQERLHSEDRRLRAEALVHASLACLDLALLTWARADDDIPFSDTLQQTFSMLNAD